MKRLLIASLSAATLALGACASNPTTRNAGEFTHDAAITAKVKTAIARQVSAGTAANVNVQTYRGDVQLTGFVNNRQDAQRAADAARGVSGVKVVTNDIQVKPGG